MTLTELAKSCGAHLLLRGNGQPTGDVTFSGPALAAFAKRIRAEEREACICSGTWRAIVKGAEPLIGRRYRRHRDGTVYTFFGIVHADDDYYYGMYNKDAGLLLCSCAGPLGEGMVLDPPDAAIRKERNV